MFDEDQMVDISRKDPATGRRTRKDWIVTADGEVRNVLIGAGMPLEVQEFEDRDTGRIVRGLVVGAEFARLGWIRLAAAYKADSRAEVREKGLGYFLKRQRMGRQGKVKGDFTPWLPEEVLKRRAAAEKRTVEAWTVPAAPADQPAAEAKEKAKR